jgi:hypothetical protein
MIEQLSAIVGKDHVLTVGDLARWGQDWMGQYK